MTLESILSKVNYNIEKIIEELRNRINALKDVKENIDKDKIIYSYLGDDFCLIRIKNDNLEIDFKIDRTFEDPIEFSWKIRKSRKDKYDRRMHIKNMFDIETTMSMISQSYRGICRQNEKRKY